MSTAFCVIASLVVATGIPITGRVVDENEQPVAGAVVRISTGKPRQGPQMTCPSCYTDCGKIAISDELGKFQIDSVSTKLFFGLAAGAHGYQGQLLDDIDPLEPELTLNIKRLEKADPEQTLAGRVVDLQGRPVPGAVVSVGTVFYQSGPIGGPDEGITPATVTDAEGKFRLTARTPVRQLALKIRASGFAAVDVNSMRPGRDGKPIVIGPGASLMGRLLLNGKPAAGLKLGLVQEDRGMGNVVTPQTMVTAEDGSFRWDQLPPGVDYVIYSLIGQDHKAALPVTIAPAPASGMLADLGDLEAQRSHRLTVQFITADKQPIAEKSYCSLSRNRAWHSYRQFIPTKEGKAIVFEGLASEVTGLGIRVPGYEVSKSVPFCQIDLNRRLNLYPTDEQTITITLEKIESQ